MKLRDIHDILDSWAPREVAWEKDNVGLQIGSPLKSVRKILVALEVNDGVIDEAVRKKADLIISHHPLLFHPLKSVNGEERTGRLLMRLARHGISVYCVHTNLDFIKGGVSFALADKIGLLSADILVKKKNILKKIAVFVPTSHTDKVMNAMAAAGAGKIGKYDFCSFQTEGSGTFLASKGSNPFLGKIGRMESVRETKLEMVAPAWKLEEVLSAMRSSHPYEEVAYDVYDLSNASEAHGAGAIGELKKPLRLEEFLTHVCRALNVRAVRYSGNLRRSIRRVAVCGGSGSEMIPAAIKQGADALITGDIGYHRFEEGDGRIALIDAGHFETELPVVKKVVAHLMRETGLRGGKVQVSASRVKDKAVHYHIS